MGRGDKDKGGSGEKVRPIKGRWVTKGLSHTLLYYIYLSTILFTPFPKVPPPPPPPPLQNQNSHGLSEYPLDSSNITYSEKSANITDINVNNIHKQLDVFMSHNFRSRF